MRRPAAWDAGTTREANRRAEVWRRAAAAGAAAILLVAAIGGVAYRLETRHRRSLLMAEAEHLVELQRDFLSRELRAVHADLRFLAQQPSLGRLLADEPGARPALEREWGGFAGSKPLYDQIRFLDLEGREVVRVNRRGERVTAVPGRELQSKASRYYFRDAIGLEREEIFVSPLDLNVEHDRIERPPKPVIRLATPVFDGRGTRRGLLVLNYAGGRLLDELRQVAGAARGNMLLVNREGEYLQAPDPGLEWGWLLGHGSSFRADHFRAWEQIRRGEASRLEVGDALLTARWVALDGGEVGRGSDVLIVSLVPIGEAGPQPGPGGLLLALAILAAIGTLAFHWARAAVAKRDHERHIAASEARLRILSTRLIAAQEEERRSLSRVLHDELGQRVTALALDLKSAAAHGSAGERASGLERAIRETEELLASLHEIATRVRPSLLDDLGLADTIDSFVSDFERRTGVAVETDLRLPEHELPANTAENAYRILQEALANVAHHARTDAARVRLVATGEALDLSVEDDGCGFEPAELRETTRLGVLGMRERAELLGGEFSLETSPGSGTAVRVRLPLESG